MEANVASRPRSPAIGLVEADASDDMQVGDQVRDFGNQRTVGGYVKEVIGRAMNCLPVVTVE